MDKPSYYPDARWAPLFGSREFGSGPGHGTAWPHGLTLLAHHGHDRRRTPIIVVLARCCTLSEILFFMCNKFHMLAFLSSYNSPIGVACQCTSVERNQ